MFETTELRHGIVEIFEEAQHWFPPVLFSIYARHQRRRRHVIGMDPLCLPRPFVCACGKSWQSEKQLAAHRWWCEGDRELVPHAGSACSRCRGRVQLGRRPVHDRCLKNLVTVGLEITSSALAANDSTWFEFSPTL